MSSDSVERAKRLSKEVSANVTYMRGVRTDLDNYLDYVERTARMVDRSPTSGIVDKLAAKAVLAAVAAVRGEIHRMLDPLEIEMSNLEATMRGLVRITEFDDEWVKVVGDANQASGELIRA